MSETLISLDSVLQSLNDIVSHYLSKAELFPPVGSNAHNDYYYGYQQIKAKPKVKAWFRIVKLGLEVDIKLAVAFFQRMAIERDKIFKSMEYGSEHLKKWIADRFLPAAIDQVLSWAKGASPPILPGNDSLQVFWTMVLDCYTEMIGSHIKQFLVAMQWCGGFEVAKHR